MVDPASITLGAVALLLPLFEACERLHHGYHITQAFGHDFVLIKICLEAQHARLQQLRRRPLRTLKGHEQMDLEDRNDPTISAVIRYLAVVKRSLEECYELMERYQKKDEPGQHTQTIEGGGGSIEPTSQPSEKTSETTITLVHDDQAGQPAKHRKKSALQRLRLRKTRQKPASMEDKIENKTNTQNLTHMSGARSQPSILSSTQVESEYERQGQEASALQASVHFVRRVPWAFSHRKELRGKINEIGRALTNLESLLMPWPIEKTSYQQPPSEEARSSSKKLLLVKGALTRLHEALMHLNEQAKGRQPFRLSIQLREDVDMSRRELAREPNVHLRTNSFVFNIQRQREVNLKDDSSLFFAESLVDVTSHEDQLLSDLLEKTKTPMMDLTELHDLITIPETARSWKLQDSETVETWGYFRIPSNEKDTHVLFHDSSGKWSSPLDLADILADCKYRPMMSPTQIVQLARLILLSHLYFSAVRQSLAIDPRPTHYRFFSGPDEDVETWNADEPLVLRPWLAFGFGSRAQRFRLGGGPGIAKLQNASLIELGLVLYQIGAGQTIEYGAGKSGLLRAKSNALKDLNKVDESVGITLTDIVQACLSPEKLASNGGKLEEEEETDIIINFVSSLERYEQHLEGTISEAEGQANAGENEVVHTLVAGASNEILGAHTSAGADEPGKDLEDKPKFDNKFKLKPHEMNADTAEVAAADNDKSKSVVALASTPSILSIPKASSVPEHQHAVEDALTAMDNRMMIQASSIEGLDFSNTLKAKQLPTTLTNLNNFTSI